MDTRTVRRVQDRHRRPAHGPPLGARAVAPPSFAFTRFMGRVRTLLVMLRPRRRTPTLILLLAAVALALAVGLPGRPDPVPAAPGAQRLSAHARARADADVAALAELAQGDDVAAYRAALDLTGLEVAPELRLAALERVLELRLDDPLARRETTELQLLRGEAAERAGRPDTAVEAYREALPDPRAAEALRRLIDDPYRLSNALLQARRYRDALDALGELTAPSIEAPALRALDRHEEALAAYRRWLEQVPGDLDARYGVAWSHWYLGDLAAAEAAFAELPGESALYGRALIANRRGEVDEAVRLLRATGTASRLWLATSLLERERRWSEAADLYLELATGGSAYADDAAWRARTLAERLGDEDRERRAEALLPGDGYFALRLGAAPPLPRRDDLEAAAPEALATAAWLAEADDPEGARLVLAFALREAEEEAEIVALGEALTALGEYREPQRRAAALVAGGSEQLRTWRLAYPRAWPQQVGRAAEEENVPAELVWAVMRRESAFYPEAISRSGAQGLMQVMPSTWDWLAELLNEAPADPFDAHANVRYGVHYLGWLQDYFGGDLQLAVASYNRGQGYVRRLYESDEVRRDLDELMRSIDALETREYLQAVWSSFRTYQELARLEAQGLPGAAREAVAPTDLPPVD